MAAKEMNSCKRRMLERYTWRIQWWIFFDSRVNIWANENSVR